MTKKFLAALTALALALIALCGCSANKADEAKIPTVGILQPVQHAALDAATEGFIAALADNGYVDGETVNIDLENAQGDTNNLSTIADQFVSDKVDLVLCAGTGAAQAMAGKTTEIPILGTAVTDYVSTKLVKSNEVPGGNVSGTSDMNPIKEQIYLIVKLVPDAKTIGLLYTSSEDNSVLQAGIAKAAIEAMGLAFTEITVNNSNDVQQAVQQLAGQCDAIYIPTDNTVASAMPVVHSVTVVTKTPVICGESNMVLNGGLASLGIDYYELGYQTGLMAIRILNGEAEIASMPVEFAAGFTPSVNREVASELGIEIPADLAEYLIDPAA